VTEAEKLTEKAVIEVEELRHANNAVSNIIRSWHPAYGTHLARPVYVPEDHEKKN
jgi:hypothetical protein